MQPINESEIDSFVFKHPFACMLAGPSKSGKTTLLEKLLRYNQEIIDNPPERIIYCYSRDQEFFKKFSDIYPQIEFYHGLPEMDTINSNQRNLIILDDLMTECERDSTILDLFTKDSHHKIFQHFL